MVFDVSAAPSDHVEFLNWYRTQTDRSKGQSPCTLEVTTVQLKDWFMQMTQRFPELQGPDTSPSSMSGDVLSADYSIGAKVIYTAFAWSSADHAYETAFSLAAKCQLGFFAASSDKGEIWLPDDQGNMRIVQPKGRQPETTVLFRADRNSLEVRTLYNVFSWGREALGEYLFYGEIDSRAVKTDNTGDLSKAGFHAEVSVNFESDVLSTAHAECGHYLENAARYGKFSLFSSIGGRQLADMNPEEICACISSDSALIVSATANGYRTFNANPRLGIVQFTSTRIDSERVTTIRVAAKDHSYVAGWLWSRFITLCQEYADLPMARFHGAIRE